MHGFGIARWIQRTTDDVFQVEEGTLYPALYRMENKGWVKGEWRITENNRRAKYYRLTAAGKRRLAEEAKTWDLFAEAMAKIMRAEADPPDATRSTPLRSSRASLIAIRSRDTIEGVHLLQESS